MSIAHFLVLLGFILGSPFVIHAQEKVTNWQLIYENDGQGVPMSGKLSELILAVRQGEELRIGWGGQNPDDPRRKVEHVAAAKFLTILSDSTVMAQIDPILGQSPDFHLQQILLKENLEWTLIAGSNGKSDALTRNTITGEIMGHNQRPRAIKWFVRRTN